MRVPDSGLHTAHRQGAVKDVAELSNVLETHLARVICFTATTGFLNEPQPSYVAYTPSSAALFTNLAFYDAAVFLAESAASAVLQMARATHRFGDSRYHEKSAYNLALNTTKPFHALREEQPKLSRQ